MSEFASALVQSATDRAEAVSYDSVVNKAAWVLVGRAEPKGPTSTIDIVSHKFVIGRRSNSDLHLPNATVSGQHAEILTINGQLFLKDLESRNGTFLNGRRIKSAALLEAGDILHFGSAMYTLAAVCAFTTTPTLELDSAHSVISEVLFKNLLSDSGIIPYFQPIIRYSDMEIIGYEALARSAIVGLESPADMFRVAAKHSAEIQLSQKCRSVAIRELTDSHIPETMNCFLNTHPNELDPEELIQSLVAIRETYPDRGMTIEIHESAVPPVDFLRSLQERLKEINVQVAYDDFGAGQTRVVELMETPPDVVKFDIQFVRGLQVASQQRLNSTKALVKMIKDLGALTLAEGVETVMESEICIDIGFDLAQGYLFGRPVAVAELEQVQVADIEK